MCQVEQDEEKKIFSYVLRVRWSDLKHTEVRACIDFAEVCIKEQSHKYRSEQHFQAHCERFLLVDTARLKH